MPDSPGHDPRILIVDDEAIVAEEIRARLEDMGYCVSAVVGSGDEALRQVRGDRPDLVLMDIMLKGGTDGVAVANQIRQDSDIPVVYLTAYSDDETFQRAKATEPFGYLLKPFNDKELCATIDVAVYKHRLECELKARQQWLSVTLTSIADAVIATDADGSIVFMNPVAQSLTGWQQDEAAGRPLGDVFAIQSERTGQLAPSPAAEALGNGVVTSIGDNAVLVARDGRNMPIADKMAPIRDAAGRIIGGILVFQDITEQRQTERRLRELQKMETIGKLAGGIAHHFNNLLTVIMGNAQLLRSDPLAVSDLADTVDHILRASRQAAELTGNLLTFARESTYHPVLVDLHDIIDEVVGMLQKTIDRRIRITGNLRADPSVVLGSPDQLRNALVHLGINARDAMAEGGDLTFATRNVALDESDCRKLTQAVTTGNYLEITVRDTGGGMDPQTLEQVFEPFFTTKAVGQATGMGLASVYGCVHSHNGAIRLESTLGQGTTATILLPVESFEEAAAPARQVAEAAPARRGRPHILIVDDEPDVAELAATVLRMDGHTVTICHNGADAVDFFRKRPTEIDLVILDLVMPKMDGNETFVKMKEINPNVRVLLSSGYSRNDMPSGLMRMGVLGFLAKPYAVEELARAVKRYLDA